MAAAAGDQECSSARTLSPEEVERLQKDQTLVPEFKRNKLEREAEKNWDLFYKRNTTRFFKDRHWTKREFEELVTNEEDSSKRRVLLEVGCGVGNFMFPLLEEDGSKALFIYACDFSRRAVQFVKEHPSYDASRCHVFHADITASLAANVPHGSVDVATMIFVLSAIHPDKMGAALANVRQCLKPGGVLLFRDYGLHDYAMLRFAPGHKLDDRFYVRQDGTRAYYFSLEVLKELAELAGLETSQIQYVYRDTVNKKEGLCVPRIFVQARLTKPAQLGDGVHRPCQTGDHQTNDMPVSVPDGRPVSVPDGWPVSVPDDRPVSVPDGNSHTASPCPVGEGEGTPVRGRSKAQVCTNAHCVTDSTSHPPADS